MQVPFLDLKTQNNTLKNDILPLWEEILDSAGFIGGKHVAAFEQEFADAAGVDHSVLVNSGTDALRFIFLALDLKEGDEVITVPNTFIATTEAITQASGKIRFVDIDPQTYNIDPSKLKAAITPRTRGIVPVHLYGQPADMDKINSIAQTHGLWVVEDSCQAHFAEYKGQKAGSIGTAGAFSFYPGKNMGACGEGGAITTNNPKIAERVKMFRDHGQLKKYHHQVEGYNGRCDALQAAALRVKLKHIARWNSARRKNASLYKKYLSDVPGIILPVEDKNCKSVYHLFVVQVENRDKIQADLEKKGIATGLHYPIPLHLQKAYSHMKHSKTAFSVTESCAEKLISLPMYPELTEEQIIYVTDSLKESLKGGQE